MAKRPDRIASANGTIEMVGLSEFARRMSVCPNTIRNWVRDGKLVEGKHYLHIGNVYRFPWGGDGFVVKLLQSLAPEPAPHRPQLKSRRPNRGRLHYRA